MESNDLGGSFDRRILIIDNDCGKDRKEIKDLMSNISKTIKLIFVSAQKFLSVGRKKVDMLFSIGCVPHKATYRAKSVYGDSPIHIPNGNAANVCRSIVSHLINNA